MRFPEIQRGVYFKKMRFLEIQMGYISKKADFLKYVNNLKKDT